MRTSVALIAMLMACGGKKDEPPKKDPPKQDTPTPQGPGSAAAAPQAASTEKKPIPADKLVGSARLVNLLVGKDGKTQPVDVWAVGGPYAPTKLASNIELGKASDWFATPLGTGMHLVVVPKDAPGDDNAKLGTMSPGIKDKHETTVLHRDGDQVKTSVAPVDDLAKPPAGKGLVLLDAIQLMGFEKELQASPLGGRNFQVKAPGGTCAPDVLGGTNTTRFVVDPGKAKITLHKWPGKCDTPELYAIEVDVAADRAVRVELFTKDGKALDKVEMPIPLLP